jgi:predicted DNA-binding transcriptional regulator YafY
MSRQIHRQWTLLKLLKDKDNAKSTSQLLTDVNKNLEDIDRVCIRTVQRDINALSVIFPIGEEEILGKENKHKNEREKIKSLWYWESNEKLWLPGLTNDEALALIMVKKNMEQLLPEDTVSHLSPYFEAAKEKLEAMKDVRPWSNKFRLIPAVQQLQPAKVGSDAAKIVRKALLNDTQIDIEYRNRADTKTLKDSVNPLALIQKGIELYLIYSLVGDDPELKFLPLQRIKKAKSSFFPKDGQKERHENFNVDDFLSTGALGFGATYPIKVGEELKLSAYFSDKTGQRLRETPLSEDQKLTEQADGRYLLTATIAFTAELLWWLLSYGANVEVLGPPELRALMKKNLQEAAGFYQED